MGEVAGCDWAGRNEERIRRRSNGVAICGWLVLNDLEKVLVFITYKDCRLDLIYRLVRAFSLICTDYNKIIIILTETISGLILLNISHIKR